MESLATINTLRIDYQDAMIETIAEHSLWHLIFQKVSHKGDYIELPTHVRTSPSMTFGTDGGQWPDSGEEDYLKAAIYQKFFAGTLALTTGVNKLARDDGAVRNAADDAVERFTNGLTRFFSAIACGDGTGKVGGIEGNTAVSGGRIVITIAMSEIFLPTLLTWKNAYLDVYNSTNFVETIQIKKLVANTGAAGQFQVETTASAAATLNAWAGYDLYWRGVAGGESSYLNAMQGLDGLYAAGTGTFQNINLSDYPEYACYVDDNGGVLRSLDVEMHRRAGANAFGRLGRNTPVGKIAINVNTFGELDSVGDSLVRYSVGDATVGRAVERTQTNNGAFTYEPCSEMPDSRSIGYDESQLYCYEGSPLEFVDRGDGMWFVDTQAKKIVANCEMIAENAIHDRRSGFKIIDLDSSNIRRESIA